MSQKQGSDYISGPGPSTSNSSISSHLQPLRFQKVYSSRIEISPDRTTARVSMGYHDIAFTDRPIRINEKVCLRYTDIQSKNGAWSSLICIAFCNFNASCQYTHTIDNMRIKFTSSSTPLKCQEDDQDKILHFYINMKGEVHYGIDGEEKGVILSNVDTSGPLWAMIKLYGGLREVKLLDPEMLDGVIRPNQNQFEDGVRRSNLAEDGVRRTNQNQVEDGVRRSNQSQVKNVPNFDKISRPSTSNTSGTSNQIRFHSAHSSDMEISPDRSTAKLARHSYGATFSDRPVRINEKVYVQYVHIKVGGHPPDMSVGFTSIDPATLGSVPNILHPMNKGYWITWLRRNHQQGQISHFYVNKKGEVHYGVNGEEKGVILSNVDTSEPLWAAIQLFSDLSEVKLVDAEALDRVIGPKLSQVENVRRTNQIKVDDGVRRQNQIEVGVKRTNQINQSQVKNVPTHNFGNILCPNTPNTSGTSNLQPLRFHCKHSNEIVISPDRTTAKSTKFHSGVTFSDRPVRINEKICLRCFNINKRPGVLIPSLTIGFTSVDPALVEWVPSMLNPMEHEYSEQNGYWMKCLRNLYYEKDVKLLQYYVNEKGEVHYGINGEELGVIFSNVKIGGPLWAVIQLFGGIREVKLVGPDGARGLNQVHIKDGERCQNQNQVQIGVIRPSQSQVIDGVRRPNQSQVKNDPLANRISTLSIDIPLPTRYQNLVPLILHRTKGQNIKRNQCDGGNFEKIKGGFSKNYVFSAQPMRLGQTIVVQIISTEQNKGSLTIGLTSCDPKTLTPHELPEDLGSLQDRPEYWVGYPANGLQTGDELDITLTRDGKMEIKTSSVPVVYHVDHTINLWAFINIIGTTTVKLLISSQNKKKPRKNQKRKESLQNSKALASETKDMPSTSRQTLSECTICLEDQIDSVIYKCGHMCMCYNCAVKQWKGKGSASGRCPLCRGMITDVIRTYIP